MKITFKHLSVCVQGWLSQEIEPCGGDLSSGNLLGNVLGINVCEEVRETGPSRGKQSHGKHCWGACMTLV